MECSRSPTWASPAHRKNQRVHINAGVFRYHPTKHVSSDSAKARAILGRRFRRQGPVSSRRASSRTSGNMIQGRTTCARAGSTTASSCMTISRRLPTTCTGRRPPTPGPPTASPTRPAAATPTRASCATSAGLGRRNTSQPVHEQHPRRPHQHGHPEAKVPASSGTTARISSSSTTSTARSSTSATTRDGSVYMIDWLRQEQCHSPNPAVHDRTTGRIFKVSYGDTPTTPSGLHEAK